MAKKKLIRLTESDLHQIIKESVNKILAESGNVGRGRFSIYPRSSNIKIIDNQLGTSYLYYIQDNSWDRNAVPDFSGVSIEELQRAGVQNPQVILNSINQINGGRQKQQQLAAQQKQQQMTQQRSQQTTQQRPQQSYDDRLKEYARQIKNGYPANSATERDLDRMLRMGLVTPNDLRFVYDKENYLQGRSDGSSMPRFY